MAKVNIPLFVGKRYSRAKRGNGFISFISMISVVGIALGVWALITVISIMNGFEKELRGRILDVASHVSISDPPGKLLNWSELAQQVQSSAGVVAVAPYIQGQGLLTNGRAVHGVLVKGILPNKEQSVSAVAEHLYRGHFDDLKAGEFNIILGLELANLIGADIGDKVTLISPNGQSTPAGLMPRLKRFNVVGVFNIGMYEYDSTLALMHLNDAAKLYKYGNGVSGLRLKLDDVFQAGQVSQAINQQLDYRYYVDNWTRQHQNFFRALAIEKRVMFVILFLIVAVAAFNIVATLVMVVTDKQSDIAILRTLGLSPKGVMGVFFVQGVSSGLLGTLIGALLGVLTALNIGVIVPFLENLLGFQFFPADVYVISEFPAQLQVNQVVVIVISALIMSMLATLYPAWRASKTQPAEALRYE